MYPKISIYESKMIEEELERYQLPSNFTSELREKYIIEYIRGSIGRIFFKGYTQPDIITRAKIYHTIIVLNNQYSDAFIVFYTYYGIVIKCYDIYEDIKDSLLTTFDLIMDRIEGKIVVLSGYDRIPEYESMWYRKYLTRFLEQDDYCGYTVEAISEGQFQFIYVAFDDPPKNIVQKWAEYRDGGTIKSLVIKPNQLTSVMKIWPCHLRIGFSVNGDDITVYIRAPNKEFNMKNLCITSDTSLYKFTLPFIIQDNDSVVGICLASKIPCIPLPGTQYIYSSDEHFSISIPDGDIDVSEDSIDVWSMDRLSDMDPFRKSALVKTPNAYLGFLATYLAKREDPTTRQEFSTELNAYIDSCFDTVINRTSYFNGFRVITPQPSLDIVEHDDLIFMFIAYGSKKKNFWVIPNIEDISDRIVYVISAKWSDKTLFGNKVFPDDPMLFFHPKLHDLFITTNITGWPNSNEKKIELLTSCLAMILNTN